MDCCSCFCLRPRYMRLVDNIFPQVPQDGLIKSNMEKLTFYCLSSPEKTDRIAECLYQRASRDLSRKRYDYVVMAMEAMDQLLLASQAQTLNLFAESFLRMVQLLLESLEPNLQALSTESFVKFSNIEEDTPSYHRRYDFFVSKFSSMCHNNDDNLEIQKSIRIAGIKGLQGVIRKTVADDLVENIWEPVHMEKIIPSLLFNLKEYEEKKDEPSSAADTCLRELIARASFGHVRAFLIPVLRHLDNHELWVPNEFAVHTFKIIMSSIQTQYSYAVVENLMYHLDSNVNSPAIIRTSIVQVLSKTVSISAGESIGPSVLEFINSLLGHLKLATGRSQEPGEMLYMESLIHCLGEYTSHLPDYQMVEIMVFILSKIPANHSLLCEMLLRCLLIVGKKYTNTSMTITFPTTLFVSLLHLSSETACVLLVHKILQTLLDRHSNVEKLGPKLNFSDLTYETCSRSDTVFLRKHEDSLYAAIIETLSAKSQSTEILVSVYTTTALIGVEFLNIHTISGYLSMIHRIQELGKQTNSQKVNLHIIVICLFKLAATIMKLESLDKYLETVIKNRENMASYLLPPFKEYHFEVAMDNDLYLDEGKLSDLLMDAGIDIMNISRSLKHRLSIIDSSGINLSGSNSDIYQSEVDSATSTPGIQRKPLEHLNFDAMKKVLNEPLESLRAAQRKKQIDLMHHFNTASFQEIMENNTVKDEDTLRCKLGHVFDRLPQTPPSSIFEADSPFMRMMVYV